MIPLSVLRQYSPNLRPEDLQELGPIEYDQTKVPMIIRKHANNVRTKTYGQEVREAQARNAEVAGLIASEAVDISNETKSRQDTVETQFNSVQQEMTDKDVISAPEIIAARGGLPQLEDRLDAADAQLVQTEKRTEGFVHVSQFGAVGDYYLPDGSVNPNPTDDTQAILDALSANKRVEFSEKGYLMKDRLILNGHTIKGSYHGDTWGTRQTTSITFDDMPDVDSCVLGAFSSQIDNILFEHAAWDNTTPEINGLIVDRKLIVNNCGFNAFPGHGALLYRRENDPDKAPYMSQFNNCVFDFNKKHGVVLGNGCNAVTIVQPHARWNGATAYKQQPSVIGDYDGIYLDGKMSELPAGLNLEPSGNTLIGGNISYNSRYGVNHRYGNDNVHIGGYLEHNLKNDIAIDSSYGLSIVNPMAQNRTPTITTSKTDPLLSSRNLTTYPNNIIIRGRNFGDGTKNKNSLTQSLFVSSYLENGPIFTSGNGGRNFVFDKAFGGTGDDQSFLKVTDLIHLNAKNAVFGTDQPTTQKGVWLYPWNAWENSEILRFVNKSDISNDNTVSGLYAARGAEASNQSAALRLNASSVTQRSINTGGTVNTSGADYAEYFYKEIPEEIIERGDLCGVNRDGKLTKVFSDAISFLVKSTNPSFVGGDNWTKGIPNPPRLPENVDKDNDALMQYQKDKQAFEEHYEKERAKVDRIAFSGITPVNVDNAKVGDYIIPIEDNGKIKGIAVKDPSFEEYKNAVGKVIKFNEEDKPVIIVKTI